MYYPLLTTIDALRAIDLSTVQTTDDEKLKRHILVAGQVFTQLVGSRITPYFDTKYYNHPYPLNNQLRLNDNLLELTALTTEEGERTILLSDVILRCGDNANITPYDVIEIKLTSLNPFFDIGQTSQLANAVTGIWGWHDALENMWVNSNDTVASATSTTIVVSDADGLDAQFETRFKKLQLCKVVQDDDFEFFVVTGINTGTNTLTVIRAVNGTSQLTLTGSEIIYTYNPPYEIEQAVRRLAAFYYRQKDASRGDLDRPMITQVGVMMPPHLPKEVTELAMSLRNPLRG